jgi:sterol desaturase/sphingolipid hydroxylase (fatty acid hydroxylase superfamily)
MLLVVITLGSLAIGKNVLPSNVEDKSYFIFIGAFLWHFSFRIITFFLFYLPGYLGWSDYYAKYLINKKSTRPWERKDWTEVRNKVFRYLFVNEFVIYPVIVYGSNLRGIKLRFDSFPDFKELAAHIMVCFFVEDFCFYWAHRLLHSTPFFYQFHKSHHEIDSLFSPIGEYFHPFEYLICSMVKV